MKLRNQFYWEGNKGENGDADASPKYLATVSSPTVIKEYGPEPVSVARLSAGEQVLLDSAVGGTEAGAKALAEAAFAYDFALRHSRGTT